MKSYFRFVSKSILVIAMLWMVAACGGGGTGVTTPPGGTVSSKWTQSTGLGVDQLGEGLLRLSCPNTQLCLAVNRTAVQRSTDGGVSFALSYSFQNTGGLTAADISFPDALNGFTMVSSPTQLLKTADGGVTWMALTSTLSTTPVNSIAFSDATHGVSTRAAASGGGIYYTADAGVAWIASTITTSVSTAGFGYGKAVFVNAATGYTVGTVTGASYGVLLKTADAGKTWVDIPLLNSSSFPVSVSFIDSLHGWVGIFTNALSGTSVLSTADGGVTWAAHPFAGNGVLQPLRLACFDTLHCLAGTMVGIYGSADGGITWTLQPLPTVAASVSDLSLTSATHGVASGLSAVLDPNTFQMTFSNVAFYTNTGGF